MATLQPDQRSATVTPDGAVRTRKPADTTRRGTAIAALLACWDGSLFQPVGTLATLTSTIALAVWLLGSIALFVPPAVGALRRGSPGLLLLLPLLPLYYALVSVAAWMALYEYFTRRFAWNKTEHGLARQRAPVEAAKSGAAIPLRPAPESARY